MKVYNLLILIFSAMIMLGCSGQIMTAVNGANGEEGVIVYPLIDVVEVYETTALVNDSTKHIIGFASDSCTKKRSMKLNTRKNYSEPHRIYYEAGLLDSYTFAVTIEEGVLTGVNASSDPSKSATAAAALLPLSPISLPGVALAGDDTGLPFCNDREKLVGIYKAPEIQSYDDIKKLDKE